MKTTFKITLLLVLLASSMRIFAQDRVYTEGSVWNVSFIKTTSGMEDAYIKNLKTTWKAVHDEALKSGLILSYKILIGTSSNPQDWDMMLLVEYKNLASLEGTEDKWDTIFKKVVGNDDEMNKLMATRVSQRTIFGEKILREVVYK
jgi:hypothetical protein